MKKVIIVLGSNCDPVRNIAYAMWDLSFLFPEMAFSRMLWTDPIGMEEGASKFVNAVGVAMTDKDETYLMHCLKEIERHCGRSEEDKAKGIIRLDLDLLLYGDTRRKEEDWERDYVKQLLREMGE